MWHNIITVAHTHFMDHNKLIAFADEYGEKFGVIKECHDSIDGKIIQYKVCTWDVNTFVDAAKTSGIERNPVLYGYGKPH